MANDNIHLVVGGQHSGHNQVAEEEGIETLGSLDSVRARFLQETSLKIDNLELLDRVLVESEIVTIRFEDHIQLTGI